MVPLYLIIILFSLIQHVSSFIVSSNSNKDPLSLTSAFKMNSSRRRRCSTSISSSRISTTASFVTTANNNGNNSNRIKRPSNSNNNNNKKKKENPNKKGYQYRSSGIKTKRIKPPQWEKEGDQLLFSLQQQQPSFSSSQHDRDNTMPVKDFLLQEIFQQETRDVKSSMDPIQPSTRQHAHHNNNNNSNPPPASSHHHHQQQQQQQHLVWGDMSVGPILAPRLHALLGPSPTPIQSQAFSILYKLYSKFQATILASPTGTGKTLAYLIPLWLLVSSSASGRSGGAGKVGRIWIVAPTVELLRQIQRVVDQVFLEDLESSSRAIGGDRHGMYIVNHYYQSQEQQQQQQQQQDTRKDKDQGWLLSNLAPQTDGLETEILNSQATIIGGTPKALLQMISDYEKNQKTSRGKDHQSLQKLSSSSSSSSSWLLDQLTTVVLEESDQLFKTELVARGCKVSREDCPTVQLLEKLQRFGWGHGYGYSHSHINNHSGKKKKKNNNNSNKKPVGLVCVSATVGRTLRRQIMEITNAPSMDKAAVLITADDRTKKDARTRQKSLLPDTIEHCYAVYEKEEGQKDSVVVVDAICQVMKGQSPGRTLIFPGKLGVVTMVDELQKRNMNNVITLRDEVHWDQSAEENTVKNDGDGWESTPIYVVGEKFGRGLDIPNVSYVFLAVPPNSAAAYTHLAGRTGRGKNRGRAITMVQGMEEAKRMASLSHTLGIPFIPLETSKIDDSVNGHVISEVSSDESVSTWEKDPLEGGNNQHGREDMVYYDDMSVNQLKDVLRDKGLKVSGRKSELIERLKDNIL